jgi:RimJ/RimL family protein N-acetyltransferase
MTTDVAIRPIEPADAGALARFHATLSPETVRMRFLYVHPVLTDREIAWFTTVDHHRREALVAERDGEILGVARYDRTGPHVAEVAIVVSDRWQRQGLGTALLDALVERAAAAGVTELVADALVGNHAILRLLRRVGMVFASRAGDGVTHLRIRLDGGTVRPVTSRHTTRPIRAIGPCLASRAAAIVGTSTRAPIREPDRVKEPS